MRKPPFEVTKDIVIESGPRRVQRIATKELLDDDVTAHHYQEGLVDAMGKVIQLGESMTFLDYKQPWVWYIYERNDEGRFIPVDVVEDEQTALKVAKSRRWKRTFRRILGR